MKERLSISTITTILAGFVLVVGLAVGVTHSRTTSAAVPGINQLASQSTAGVAASGASSLTSHSISGDGKYVVFSSPATNLTPEATGGVFLRDSIAQTTTMVSFSDAGIPVSGSNAVISYDGRYVAFESNAANVVTGVAGGSHIYVRDLVSNTTKIVDTDINGVPSDGAAKPDINADGRYLVFITSDRDLTGVPVSYTPAVAKEQVVVKDIVSGKVRIVSGTTASPSLTGYSTSPKNTSPTIDCSGRVVSFVSAGTNLGQTIYAYAYGVFTSTVDWDSHTFKPIGMVMSWYGHGNAQVSCNGNSVIVGKSNQGNARQYDRLKHNTVTTSVSSSGVVSNTTNLDGVAVSTSDDGRYVAFVDRGTNLDPAYPLTGRGSESDIFVRDTKMGTTQLVSFTALGNHSGLLPGDAGSISISADGSTVAYVYNTPDASNPGGELISGVHTGQADVYISKTGF